jgi:hypothetical protein
MVMIKIINYKIKEIRLLKMNINNCLMFVEVLCRCARKGSNLMPEA